ncbi:Cu/Ag efflux pump CusA [Acidovorax soli]|uniref:Cu/Ag efflux pump CusA n=1 Tax=Acidovorax soli TaxID=592050 RepID=A0A7X0PB76_9BURK|nr:Cu/Ag efflux pump CusA [Acidovorax soli]
MIARLIRWSIVNRFLVLLTTLAGGAWGVPALLRTPLDALPDLSDVQVIIRTTYPGQAPRIVENQVTYTLTTTMLAGDIVAQEISRCITVPNLALYDLAMGGATRASSYVLRAGRLKHALSASEQKPPEQCAETCWPIAEGTPIGSEICMRLTSGQFKSVPVKTVMLRSAARGRQISRLIPVVQKRLHLLNSQPGVQCSRRSS